MNPQTLQEVNLKISKLSAKCPPVLLQMIKYGMVSTIALIVDLGLLYLLTEACGINYLISASLSFICGLVVNYSLSIVFVFKKSKFNRRNEFIAYTIIGIAGLLLNDLIIYLLVLINVWYMAAKLVSTVVVFFFNFFLRKSLYKNNTRIEGCK